MEDDLTWLVRITGGTLEPWCEFIARSGCDSWACARVFDLERNWFTKDQYMARRTELKNKPSWDDGAEELNAMAQRLLVALKSDPRSFDTGALAEMVELADAEIVKRDAAVCGGEGYLNNHWFVQGELPPVGEFVDVEGEDLVYGDGELNCEVLAHVEDTAVIRMSYGLGCFQKHVLSPSRTERDKAIEDMKQCCPYPGSWDTVGRIYAEALYDAGYRKQISPAK